MLTSKTILIVQLEARERRKVRLGESDPTETGVTGSREDLILTTPETGTPPGGDVLRGREVRGVLVPSEGPRREVRRAEILLRLVCKEDKPVSKLVILASPPEWEARIRSSPEEPDLEIH